ncbi:MAG: molybdopterin-binding protein [Thermoplasmata archaeon]|nr:molybdopterin-binding protein [Thermoplasmata archaeon]
MELLKNVIDFATARKLLLENLKPVERVEEVTVEEAVDRVAAEDIASDVDVPPFSRAAMDGYAVIADDTAGARPLEPVKLRRIGVVHAGEMPKQPLTQGTCIQIATGAVMPDGGDAVVMVEHTELDEGNETVHVYSPVRKGENVTKAGEDIRKGAVVIKKGETLTPGRIGALAAIGKTKVKVYEKPKVAIIPTGNEIQRPGENLQPGKIYDVNTYTLASIVKIAGAVPVIYSIVPDEMDQIRKTLDAALQNDLVVFAGGSSVGERDLIVRALENAELLFHGIAVKPGKPTLCARLNGKIVIGMPGYPTSCLTNAYALLLPAIGKIARREIQLKRVKARAGRRVASTIGRLQFLPVKIEGDTAVPVFKESGAITSMADADGYLEIPENVDIVEKGEEVEVVVFL